MGCLTAWRSKRHLIYSNIIDLKALTALTVDELNWINIDLTLSWITTSPSSAELDELNSFYDEWTLHTVIELNTKLTEAEYWYCLLSCCTCFTAEFWICLIFKVCICHFILFLSSLNLWNNLYYIKCYKRWVHLTYLTNLWSFKCLQTIQEITETFCPLIGNFPQLSPVLMRKTCRKATFTHTQWYTRSMHCPLLIHLLKNRNYSNCAISQIQPQCRILLE